MCVHVGAEVCAHGRVCVHVYAEVCAGLQYGEVFACVKYSMHVCAEVRAEVWA